MAAASCGQSEQDQLDAQALAAPEPIPEACVRCSSPPVFVQRGTAYCQDCFRQVLAGRFLRALEGAKTVSLAGFDAYASPAPLPRHSSGSPAAKIVVGFSGGVSSRAVLELLRTSYFSHLDPPPADDATSADVRTGGAAASGKKKSKKHSLPRPPTFPDCEVVYIDESSGQSAGSESDHADTLREIVTTQTPFRFTVLKLEDVYVSTSTSPSTSEPLVASTSSPSLPIANASNHTGSTAREQLLALVSPLSPTSRESLLASLRHTLLLSHARATGASVVLLGSTGTRMGAEMLSGMASGRGWSAGEQVGAEYVSRDPAASSADRDGRVLVVRPLALMSLREVQHLCESAGLRHIDPAPRPPIRNAEEKETSAKGRSIRSLVEDFVFSLDASFPSTAQTVVRTAHKLGQRSSSLALPLCALCGLPAQPAADEWRRAITIADLIEAKVALAESGGPAAVEVQLPEGMGGVRAPYAPSASHLIEAGAGEGSSPASAAARPGEEGGPALASLSPPASGSADDNPTRTCATLAPHLCYGCLLVLQEPGAAGAKGRPRVAALVLPPRVRDAVHAAAGAPNATTATATLPHVGRDVVGTREVHGTEALRQEVEGFLLRDEDDGPER